MSAVSDKKVYVQTLLRPFFKQCIVATGLLLNNFVHASGIAFSAVLLPQLRTSSIRLDREDESWIASILPVAMFVGNLLTVPSMRRGRKFTHYLISLLNIGGWLTITLATNFQLLMIGRFVQGMSAGLLTPVISVLLAEYTSPSRRGVFLAAISLTQALGVFFAHLVGSWLNWQNTALLLSWFPVVSVAIIVFTPESPSWLATQGRYNECRKAFTWLRGTHEDHELNKMIQARQHFDSLADSRDSAFCEGVRAITKRELYIPLVIGTAMSILMVTSGATILARYMHDIVAGLMGPDSNMAAWVIVFDGARLLSNSASLYTVGRYQRRTLLFTIGSACVLAHFAVAAYLFLKTAGLIDHNWLAASLLTFQIVTIGLGMVSMPFVILGEIFPLQYRGLCGFLSMTVTIMMMFVVMKTFPALVARAGLGGAWLTYGGAVALLLAVTWHPLPETRGRTLLDIEEYFRGKPLLPDDYDAKEAMNKETIVS